MDRIKTAIRTIRGKATRSKIPHPVRRELLIALQREQNLHDRDFHRDVLALSSHQRIRHLTFHFAKYVGRIAGSRTDNVFRATLVDAFIIALSACHALGIRAETIIHDGDAFLQPPNKSLDGAALGIEEFVFLNLAQEAGRMAKACEATDHGEPLDYASMYEHAVKRIIAILLMAATELRLDLGELVRKRWAEIERKALP